MEAPRRIIWLPMLYGTPTNPVLCKEVQYRILAEFMYTVKVIGDAVWHRQHRFG